MKKELKMTAAVEICWLPSLRKKVLIVLLRDEVPVAKAHVVVGLRMRLWIDLVYHQGYNADFAAFCPYHQIQLKLRQVEQS